MLGLFVESTGVRLSFDKERSNFLRELVVRRRVSSRSEWNTYQGALNSSDPLVPCQKKRFFPGSLIVGTFPQEKLRSVRFRFAKRKVSSNVLEAKKETEGKEFLVKVRCSSRATRKEKGKKWISRENERLSVVLIFEMRLFSLMSNERQKEREREIKFPIEKRNRGGKQGCDMPSTARRVSPNWKNGFGIEVCCLFAWRSRWINETTRRTIIDALNN